jgi:hypothetical protein
MLDYTSLTSLFHVRAHFAGIKGGVSLYGKEVKLDLILQ